MSFWTETVEGAIALKIVLTPRSRLNQILSVGDDHLRISLNAPPVDGAANKALIEFLAKLLHIPKSSISIWRGEKSRQKTLLISGNNSEELKQNIAALVQQQK